MINLHFVLCWKAPDIFAKKLFENIQKQDILLQTSVHPKLMCTYPKIRRTYPKLRRPYPKLWHQLPIGAQKFRVGAQKFRVSFLIFQNFENKYVNFFLPWPPKVTRQIAFWPQCQGTLWGRFTNWTWRYKSKSLNIAIKMTIVLSLWRSG